MPHDGHLVQLDHLVDERRHGLHFQIAARHCKCADQVVVVGVGLLHPGEQIRDDALEQRQVVRQKLGRVDVHQPAQQKHFLVVLREVSL